MRALTLTLALLSAAPATAQTFATGTPVTLDVIGQADIVGAITLTPGVPGDELLFRNKVWRHVVFVAVLHPSKSGPLGAFPQPGLCLEPAQAFTAVDVALTIADVDADGVDDVVGTSPTGSVQVLKGIRLTVCR